MKKQGHHQIEQPVASSSKGPPVVNPMAALLKAVHAEALKEKYLALDQAAVNAELAGRDEIALACYKSTIELKIQDYGELSAETAYTLDNLGTVYAEWDKLAEAEDCLVRAMKGREAVALADITNHEASLDAAHTRESLGRVYERMGRLDDARQVRLRGKDGGHILCSELNCSEYFSKEGSMWSCRCRCVFYCSEDCLRSDHHKRHWNLCSDKDTSTIRERLNDIVQLLDADEDAKKLAESKVGPVAKAPEAGPSIKGQKETTEPPVPAKKKNKKKNKKKKKGGASITEPDPTIAGEKVNNEPRTTIEEANDEHQTTAEEAKDAAQTVEGDTCPENQEGEESPQPQPPASIEPEVLDIKSAETEVHEGGSPVEDQPEDSEVKMTPSSATMSEDGQASISTEDQGDSEQSPQIPTASNPKSVTKKAQKQPPRKQAPQMSYQKWEKATKANKSKKKKKAGKTSKNPVVASSSTAEGQGKKSEPLIGDPVVEETRPTDGQEGESIVTQEHEAVLTELLSAEEDQGMSTELPIGDPVMEENWPAGGQEEESMLTQEDGTVLMLLAAEDYRNTSQHQADGPAIAGRQSAESKDPVVTGRPLAPQQEDEHEPEIKSPAVTELPLPPPPEPKNTGKAKKRKEPVVIARTPVVPWNQEGASGAAPWFRSPGNTGSPLCSCEANPAYAPYQQPALGHYGLDGHFYPLSKAQQPGVMLPQGGAYPPPGGPAFRPQASAFMPGVAYHE